MWTILIWIEGRFVDGIVGWEADDAAEFLASYKHSTRAEVSRTSPLGVVDFSADFYPEYGWYING